MISDNSVTINQNYSRLIRAFCSILFFGFLVCFNFVDSSFSSIKYSQNDSQEFISYESSFLDGYGQAFIASQSPGQSFQKTDKDYSNIEVSIQIKGLQFLKSTLSPYSINKDVGCTNILDQLHHHHFFF